MANASIALAKYKYVLDIESRLSIELIQHAHKLIMRGLATAVPLPAGF